MTGRGALGEREGIGEVRESERGRRKKSEGMGVEAEGWVPDVAPEARCLAPVSYFILEGSPITLNRRYEREYEFGGSLV